MKWGRYNELGCYLGREANSSAHRFLCGRYFYRWLRESFAWESAWAGICKHLVALGHVLSTCPIKRMDKESCFHWVLVSGFLNHAGYYKSIKYIKFYKSHTTSDRGRVERFASLLVNTREKHVTCFCWLKQLRCEVTVSTDFSMLFVIMVAFFPHRFSTDQVWKSRFKNRGEGREQVRKRGKKSSALSMKYSVRTINCFVFILSLGSSLQQKPYKILGRQTGKKKDN